MKSQERVYSEGTDLSSKNRDRTSWNSVRVVERRVEEKRKDEAKRLNSQIKKKKNIAIYVATAGYVCQGLYEGRKRQEHHVDL